MHPSDPYGRQTQAAMASGALLNALSNPYGQPPACNISPHYYNAYAQAPAGQPPTNAEGYTLSAAYNPQAPSFRQGHASPWYSHALSAPQSNQSFQSNGSSNRPVQQHRNNNTWYQPGNSRCSHPGCSFTGAYKSVELHMMDRHLVFPPGWEKRKKTDDWDADPSLKGKPVPIQGTSVVLDTPEAIGDWISERKKRFPTEQKVEDKKRKQEEARARGQLDFSRPLKRHKQDCFARSDHPRGNRGSFGRGRGRGRGGSQPGRTSSNTLAQSATSGPPAVIQQNVREDPPNVGVTPSYESSDDDDGAPEELTSKVAPPTSLRDDENDGNLTIDKPEPPEPVRKPPPKRPKLLSHNPFASRPVLLRNLLLPEIRMTVSNLSQAIRFIVDNDFLDNVELKAGEANEKMIQVVDGGV